MSNEGTIPQEPDTGAKWPFMLLVMALLVGLGYTMSTMEREVIMGNWPEHRCDIPVLVAAAFFKPDTDPRSSTEFAGDNFEFCMKALVERFTDLLMAPLQAIFQKQVDATGQAMDGMNSLRSIAQVLYNQFAAYLDVMFQKFNAAVFDMSRVIQYLKMGIQKMNAIALSLIYSGISMLRGMLNAIQFIIKVVLIICAIMVVIIIILWFILFPVIPLIIAALVIIVSSIAPFRGIFQPGLQDSAESMKRSFCFATGSRVSVMGQPATCAVEDIQVGQKLGEDMGTITEVIVMKGQEVLYSLDGILVSGSHLVQGTDGAWKAVEKDERAVRTTHVSPLLYCFNTTSNCIPMMRPSGGVIRFRDWEEIGNEDTAAQYKWNYLISTLLNGATRYQEWKSDVRPHSETPLMGKNVLVKTARGWLPIFAIQWNAVLDAQGKQQEILGVVQGEVEGTEHNGEWHTEQYEKRDGLWRKSNNTVRRGTSVLRGWNLITKTGEFVIWDDATQQETVIRDFTEVGYDRIGETYAFVESRLRTSE